MKKKLKDSIAEVSKAIRNPGEPSLSLPFVTFPIDIPLHLYRQIVRYSGESTQNQTDFLLDIIERGTKDL